MKVRHCIVSLACGVMALASANAATGDCGLPEIGGSRELHRFLSVRAIELVERAAQPGNAEDVKLGALIAPNATFGLGAGDVGRPLGDGLDGARKLARLMNADSYRFLGWDYMDGPADACAKHDVTVEFIDSQTRHVSSVKFTFDAGRLVNAAGWSRSFETGALTAAPARE